MGYLTVGSFMIRGKKNFLPPATLIMGFGFLFKLEESSVERHKGERKVRGLEETSDPMVESVAESLDEVEINVEEGDSEEEGEKAVPEGETLETIKESREIEDEEVSEAREDKEEEEKEEKAEENLEEEAGTDEDDCNITEFPDTDVKVGLDRLGSVEIKVKTETDEKLRNQ